MILRTMMNIMMIIIIEMIPNAIQIMMIKIAYIMIIMPTDEGTMSVLLFSEDLLPSGRRSCQESSHRPSCIRNTKAIEDGSGIQFLLSQPDAFFSPGEFSTCSFN